MNRQLLQIWSAYKHDLLNIDNFADNASVTLVPTTLKASNYEQLKALCTLKFPKEQYQRISTVAYNDVVFDECLLTFKHDSDILLPGVQPTNNILSANLVFSVKFSFDKISSLRIYWDKFDLLKQLGLNPQKEAEPKAAEPVQVRKSVFEYANEAVPERVADPNRRISNIFNNDAEPERPIPAKTTKNVFEKDSVEFKSSILSEKDRLASTAFNQDPVPHFSRISIDPSRHDSSVFKDLPEQPYYLEKKGFKSDKKDRPFDSNINNLAFGDIRTSRVSQVPGGKSSIVFE